MSTTSKKQQHAHSNSHSQTSLYPKLSTTPNISATTNYSSDAHGNGGGILESVKGAISKLFDPSDWFSAPLAALNGSSSYSSSSSSVAPPGALDDNTNTNDSNDRSRDNINTTPKQKTTATKHVHFKFSPLHTESSYEKGDAEEQDPSCSSFSINRLENICQDIDSNSRKRKYANLSSFFRTKSSRSLSMQEYERLSAAIIGCGQVLGGSAPISMIPSMRDEEEEEEGTAMCVDKECSYPPAATRSRRIFGATQSTPSSTKNNRTSSISYNGKSAEMGAPSKKAHTASFRKSAIFSAKFYEDDDDVEDETIPATAVSTTTTFLHPSATTGSNHQQQQQQHTINKRSALLEEARKQIALEVSRQQQSASAATPKDASQTSDGTPKEERKEAEAFSTPAPSFTFTIPPPPAASTKPSPETQGAEGVDDAGEKKALSPPLFDFNKPKTEAKAPTGINLDSLPSATTKIFNFGSKEGGGGAFGADGGKKDAEKNMPSFKFTGTESTKSGDAPLPNNKFGGGNANSNNSGESNVNSGNGGGFKFFGAGGSFGNTATTADGKAGTEGGKSRQDPAPTSPPMTFSFGSNAQTSSSKNSLFTASSFADKGTVTNADKASPFVFGSGSDKKKESVTAADTPSLFTFGATSNKNTFPPLQSSTTAAASNTLFKFGGSSNDSPATANSARNADNDMAMNGGGGSNSNNDAKNIFGSKSEKRSAFNTPAHTSSNQAPFGTHTNMTFGSAQPTQPQQPFVSPSTNAPTFSSFNTTSTTTPTVANPPPSFSFGGNVPTTFNFGTAANNNAPASNANPIQFNAATSTATNASTGAQKRIFSVPRRRR